MAESLAAPLLQSEAKDAGGKAAAVWEEMKKQLVMAGPMIGVNVLQFSLTTVAVMFVGHMDELSLASASIATSFAGVTGLSVLMGLGSGLETLCGQAFGARQYHMLGIFMQRGAIVLSMVCVFISLLWLNMGPVLKMVGQDHEISDKAGKYAAWLIPVAFGYGLLQPMQKFLQTQSIILPMLLCVVCTMAVHIPLCWFIIYKMAVGYRGAALATSLSMWFNTTCLALYIHFSPRCTKTWRGFSIEAFHDFSGFFKLAIPSAVMVCLEWWSFELLVILSGLLPNPQLELSALSICMNTISLAYMIPYGLSTAASTRISNELGAGRPLAARFAVFVVLILAAISAITISASLFSVRNVWGWVFSNEQEVTTYVASMVPFLSTLTLMDGIQAVLSGVARGCGWQNVGAFANLGAYYIVGLPTAITLAFVYHLNGRGLWMGMLGGIATQMVSLLVFTLMTDWQKQAANAQNRVYSSVVATLPVIAPLEGLLYEDGRAGIFT